MLFQQKPKIYILNNRVEKKMVNCSFCGKLITKDRYNIAHVLERQDIPNESDWQKSTDFYREDVCPKCQELITQYCYNFMERLRENKGDINKFLKAKQFIH